MNQEQIFQVQMIEQESNQLNNQLELIDQNSRELEDLKLSLHEIEKNENKEILANLGKRIYVPVEIKEKKLIVEVGKKHYVRKSIPDTIKVIDEQLSKLKVGREQIIAELQVLQIQAEKLMQDMDFSQTGKESHKHSHGCECDDDCEGGKCDECECED